MVNLNKFLDNVIKILAHLTENSVFVSLFTSRKAYTIYGHEKEIISKTIYIPAKSLIIAIYPVKTNKRPLSM